MPKPVFTRRRRPQSKTPRSTFGVSFFVLVARVKSSVLAAVVLATVTNAIVTATEVRLYVSPNGGATAAAVATIAAATETLDVAAYSLSSPQLSAAIAAAHRRGVTVRVLVDAGQEAHAYSTAKQLSAAGIAVRTDRREALMHLKTAVIDRRQVMMGSMNWTAAGEARNVDNLALIRDDVVAAQMTAAFETHWGHAAPFRFSPPPARRRTAPPPPNVPSLTPPTQ